MPPKRRKGSSSHVGGRQTKKRQTSNNNKKDGPSNPVKSKTFSSKQSKQPKQSKQASPGKQKAIMEESKTIEDLYQDCITNETAVRIHEERGDVARIIWPYLVDCAEEHKSKDTSTSTPPSSSSWSKACYLLALLVTYPCREGDFAGQSTTVSPLDFIVPHKEKEDFEQEQFWVLSQVIQSLVSMFQSSNSTSTSIIGSVYQQKTVIVRFLTVAYASGKFQTQLLPHVSSIELWHAMPERRRQLELRLASGKIRRLYSTSITAKTTTEKDDDKKSTSSIWIISLIDSILNLIEGNSQYKNLFHDVQSNKNKNNGNGVAEGDDEQQQQQQQHPEMKDDDHDDDDSDAMDEDKGEEENDSIDSTPPSKAVDVVPNEVWNFLHRSFEFLIDLLSSFETRLNLVPYLNSIHFALRCHRAIFSSSSIYHQEQSQNIRLIVQLVQRVSKLLVFPIRDITKTSLSKRDVISQYHGRASIVQKLCHRHYSNQVPDIIYAGVGLLCNNTNNDTGSSSYISRAFGGLSTPQILDLVHRLRLLNKDEYETSENHDNDDTTTKKKKLDRDFFLDIIMDYVTIPSYPLEQLKSNPLYPTESILWDHNIIPPGGGGSTSVRSTEVLSLPKLNTQFLSHEDYLLRNFELVRLESAYSIRTGICDVIRRVRPVARQVMSGNDDNDVYDVHASTATSDVWNTEFDGWARMALEIDNHGSPGIQLVKVAPPKLGESHPAQVIAELTIDLVHCGHSIRQEWDDLREYDNLFLIGIDATKATNEPAPLVMTATDHDNNHNPNKTETERRIPDEEDKNFPSRFGITAVRGCMVLQVRDEEGNILNDPTATNSNDKNNKDQDSHQNKKERGTKRFIRVELDPAQYGMDARSGKLDVYDTLNLVMRRQSKEDNFKAVLETIRGLMEGSGSIQRVIPKWLQPVLLGFGDPTSANYKSDVIQEYAKNTAGVNKPDTPLDYGDTFLDEEHLRSSFVGSKVIVDGREELVKEGDGDSSKKRRSNYKVKVTEQSDGNSQLVEATSYDFPSGVSGNPVRFTPVQVSAVRSGLSPGLTVVVGPPGTGKTDVAVQIIANLYHSFPSQRTVIITHSNAALNDLFEKVMARGDVDERYMIRLGAGERDLKTMSTHDFTKTGRVDHSLARRATLLEEVQLLSESLGISGRAERGTDGSPSYTCETAEYFNHHHVQKRMKAFERKANNLQPKGEEVSNLDAIFPFSNYFQTKSKEEGPLSLQQAREKFSQLDDIFAELAEYRPLEMLRSQRQRTDYLLMKQARIVAMTCTHAAIARSHLIDLGFHYDNVVMEEAGQMLEVETFIPLLLQRGESDESASALSRLKRVCLIGDHHQLPPVVQNISFSKFSNLDQSLFTRMIRSGVPYVQLNRQGRARAEIARLYNWRYNDLGDLAHVAESPVFQGANTGLAHTFQLINVDDYQGRGETTPSAYFYQNLGEAEYAVGLFQYMVLIGYPPEKISILTTYNGQKDLIRDILGQRCGEDTPFAGIRPGAVSTVDKYQGQQNDYVILSLVRTKAVGHIRDIRRMVVAVSRARLGVYVMCRQNLFANCHELENTMIQFASPKPSKLQLVLGEHYPTKRKAAGEIPKDKIFEIDDVEHLGTIVHSMQEKWISGRTD